jgi:hypothetical protein
MKIVSVLAAAVLLSLACGSGTGSEVVSDRELASIRQELDGVICRARMDSLCFQMEGILYRAEMDGDTMALQELLPDSIPHCPSTGLPYEITFDASTITVTCPSGHGSQTVEK